MSISPRATEFRVVSAWYMTNGALLPEVVVFSNDFASRPAACRPTRRGAPRAPLGRAYTRLENPQSAGAPPSGRRPKGNLLRNCGIVRIHQRAKHAPRGERVYRDECEGDPPIRDRSSCCAATVAGVADPLAPDRGGGRSYRETGRQRNTPGHRREGDGGSAETRIGWAASGNAGLFAFVDRLATMAFPLAVRRPKNIVL